MDRLERIIHKAELEGFHERKRPAWGLCKIPICRSVSITPNRDRWDVYAGGRMSYSVSRETALQIVESQHPEAVEPAAAVMDEWERRTKALAQEIRTTHPDAKGFEIGGMIREAEERLLSQFVAVAKEIFNF